MIVRVTGVVESVEGNRVVVAPPGIGVAYEALTPRFFADALVERLGHTVTLHTLQVMESQNQGASFTPRLLGFASPEDRRFFELFTTVKGFGARKALRALAAPVPVVARAIVERDLRALQELPEIGKRMAETIVAELHGKVEGFLGSAGGAGAVVAEGKPGAGGGLGGAAAQAVSALVRLGETTADAERMVRKALAADDTLESPDTILAAAYAMRG